MLIEKYTSKWIKDFENLKNEISIWLQDLEFSIEHVGSTSVPNLDSKPIIDIDIIYSRSLEFEQIKLALEKAGYYHNGNQGIVDREVFKRNSSSTNEILDNVKHHLYICPINSKPLERHILSRNFLRKNEWARLKYQEMKYELAEKAKQDRKIYADLKELYVNDFIDTIIAEEKRTSNT
ncbi:GrpB family protein [Lacihabitans sp. LS3-19]|uniref:GrpB family protein n=1 Tax=Lacihabitans sp. LS3-19 TaxID=2487335 RepID=UPI0020CEEBCF|nr:GrpB family protein [Lacihabitans sp. LS3-19]MCP9768880.1 GrpB family protein [Lacihabitans sp. LS3-19]